jgi:acetyl esterase
MTDTDITLKERLQGSAARALGRLPERAQLGLSRRAPVEIDGQRLDPCLQLLLAVNRKRKRIGLCEPDPVTARARFRREVLTYGGPELRDVTAEPVKIEGVGEDEPLRAWHYAPPSRDSRDLLVYLHGGGFVIGDLETHDEPCRLLCLHASTHVLSVEYRLAPEHQVPHGINDALFALKWAQDNAQSLRQGKNIERVSIGGDSAGGNLAAVAAQLTVRARPPAVQLALRPPAAQMLIYPATDAVDKERPSRKLFGRGFFLDREDCDAFFRHYTEGTGIDDDDPLVSPLRAPDVSGLAPALVVTAGFDMLRDEGDAYALRLEAACNRLVWRRFTSLTHGFLHMTGVCPSARAALVEVAREWRAMLDRPAPPREARQEESAP